MRRPLVAAVLCLLAVAAPASGQQADETKIRVQSLGFEGVKQVDEAQLRGVLATRASSWLPWGRKYYFDRARFQGDLQRIQAFYADRGFPDARVTSFDIDLNQKGDRVSLRITISEGEPVKVTTLAFKGFDVVPERRLTGLRRRAPLKEGQPLDRAAVATTREMALNVLRDVGYPWPSLTVDQVNKGSHEAELTFSADPGPKATFGDTDVAGLREVSPNLVTRELLFEPGDVYRLSAIQESQRKLYNLELFEFVSLRPAANDPEEQKAQASANRGRVPMKVTVTESKHRHLNFSVGYGTEDRARAEGRVRQLNFLGGARTAELHGKWSSLDRGLQVRFTNPHFFAPRWSLDINAQRWYEFEPAFRSVQSGAHATFTYRRGIQNVFSVTLTELYQSSRISNAALMDLALRPLLISLGLDPTTGSQDGSLSAVAIDARRTTARNLLDSRNGYMVGVHLEKAGGPLPGTFNYTNVSFEARHFLPVTRRVVVASRVQFGGTRPAGRDLRRLPFAKRYFLGGADSLRGWGRYDVSPLSGSGLPIGGLTMAAATMEVRAWIWGELGGVLFLDAGNAWSDPWQVRLNDLRYAVGPGFRYLTPVGPLRIDLGYQLNPIKGLLVDGKPEKRRWRVHFSIGQAF